jgi:hypothetical protein
MYLLMFFLLLINYDSLPATAIDAVLLFIAPIQFFCWAVFHNLPVYSQRMKRTRPHHLVCINLKRWSSDNLLMLSSRWMPMSGGMG